MAHPDGESDVCQGSEPENMRSVSAESEDQRDSVVTASGDTRDKRP